MLGAIWTFLTGEYAIHLGILICIYLILAHGLNLAFGMGKMLNLAHIAVYAIGAYTTALLSKDLGQPIWICIPASIFTSALFALLLGAISSKLEDDYFAIGTLAFSAVVSALLVNWKSLTRGVLGIPGIPRPELFGVDFRENGEFLQLATICAAASLLFVYVFRRTAFARALCAQSENPAAAQALGKNTRNIRHDTFIISSALAGLAGSLFAYYINYIDPSSFTLYEMVFVLSIVVIGKPGSFWGVTAATVFLVLLPEPLRYVGMPSSILGPMRQLLHSVILFGVVYWYREKIFPVERSV